MRHRIWNYVSVWPTVGTRPMYARFTRQRNSEMHLVRSCAVHVLKVVVKPWPIH